MNNMRRGFTMIELVFVIVIIGILSAVALPKFMGISNDAHVGKLTAFVGTLNRTVGPSMWSGLLRNDKPAAGSVLATSIAQYKDLDTEVSDPTNPELESIPDEFKAESIAGKIALSTNCGASGTVMPTIGSTDATGLTAIATSELLGSSKYELKCIDGDLNGAPRFFLVEQTTSNVVAN